MGTSLPHKAPATRPLRSQPQERGPHPDQQLEDLLDLGEPGLRWAAGSP